LIDLGLMPDIIPVIRSLQWPRSKYLPKFNEILVGCAIRISFKNWN